MRALRVARGLALVLMVSSVACLRQTEFRCQTSADCGGGTCASTGAASYCAVSDPSCPDGLRFGSSAGTSAGQCVGGGSGGDGGIDGSADAPIDGAPVGCPSDYATISGGQTNHVYKLIATPTDSWANQVTACDATAPNRAYLAIPDDQNELDGIVGLANNINTLWVGVSDMAAGGTYVTVKNQPATFLPFGSSDNAKNCVAADTQNNGQYNDTPCAMHFAAVCECEP